MSVTSLVTDGFICYRRRYIVYQPASLDQPNIVGVVEVRPKIRRATTPGDIGQPKPAMLSAQELKPSMTAKAEEAPTTAKPPTTRTAQELKPRIVRAKEED